MRSTCPPFKDRRVAGTPFRKDPPFALNRNPPDAVLQERPAVGAEENLVAARFGHGERLKDATSQRGKEPSAHGRGRWAVQYDRRYGYRVFRYCTGVSVSPYGIVVSSVSWPVVPHTTRRHHQEPRNDTRLWV